MSPVEKPIDNNQFPITNPQLKSVKLTPAFDFSSAQSYNVKSEQYFKPYAEGIKKILGTNSDWKSPEFAKAVFDWQQKNGLTGKWIDGKLGPVTVGKMTQVDSQLSNVYDPYMPWKMKHVNEKPYKRVMTLKDEVERIRNEMGASDIPLSLLLGWIQVESGGRVDDLTTSAKQLGWEAGLFQLSRDEAATLGADKDKLLTDKDYSIRAGIKLAQHHAQGINRILAKYPGSEKIFAKGSEMYWRLVFFSFSAGPGVADALVGRLVSSGQSISSWDDVMRFAAQNPHGYKHSPIKWSYHTQRMWNIGSQAVGNKPAIAALVSKRIKEAALKARQIIIGKLK